MALVKKTSFLTSKAKLAFTQLWQVFTKAPILCHFDLKCHIRIETNVSSYAIGGILSQLASNLGQWNLMIFFSRKMIFTKTCYKTYNGKLLAIVKAFKTWRHYLEGYKYKVLILTDHNNFCQFMDTKSLSSKQVRWAQKFSWYHFQIDYHQNKANGAANALSCFSQRSQSKKEELWAKNTQILHRLQFSLTNTSLLELSFFISASNMKPLH